MEIADESVQLLSGKLYTQKYKSINNQRKVEFL